MDDSYPPEVMVLVVVVEWYVTISHANMREKNIDKKERRAPASPIPGLKEDTTRRSMTMKTMAVTKV